MSAVRSAAADRSSWPAPGDHAHRRKNAYTGTTTINGNAARSDRLGNGGTSGTLGTAAVTDNGTLNFNRSDSVSVGLAIGGTGVVQKIGAGILTFSGTNTYTGPTAVSQGTLVEDFSVASTVSNILRNGSVLMLGVANPATSSISLAALTMNGKASAANTQTFTATTLGVNANVIRAIAGTNGSANLVLGTVTRASSDRDAFILPGVRAISIRPA